MYTILKSRLQFAWLPSFLFLIELSFFSSLHFQWFYLQNRLKATGSKLRILACPNVKDDEIFRSPSYYTYKVFILSAMACFLRRKAFSIMSRSPTFSSWMNLKALGALTSEQRHVSPRQEMSAHATRGLENSLTDRSTWAANWALQLGEQVTLLLWSSPASSVSLIFTGHAAVSPSLLGTTACMHQRVSPLPNSIAWPSVCTPSVPLYLPVLNCLGSLDWRGLKGPLD